MKTPYRAFIKANKRMMDVVAIFWNNDGTINEVRCDFEDNEGDPFIYNEKDLVLMRDTGLKDKEGKRMFEGDILKKDRNLTYKIKYYIDHYYCGFVPESISGIRSGGDMKDSKIIGNIYENPEFLKQT